MINNSRNVNFHFNVRFIDNTIVLNNRLDYSWGLQNINPTPFKRDQNVKFVIYIGYSRFKVNIILFN
jgi:hypothetical protein